MVLRQPRALLSRAQGHPRPRRSLARGGHAVGSSSAAVGPEWMPRALRERPTGRAASRRVPLQSAGADSPPRTSESHSGE